ncbi:hypothetical protein ENKNEFLB_02630 [Nocardioides aquaticus]|uniref:Uncharacterized protein n=1 Tax=Nocardioides aquaticus TaxID=160826 RepID=A0ABX8EJ01_9ACTN|nr:hypothetical protein [Nocardioides aquaticus]QVT80239.1 hypothetical protein ENKNEFLB_02630 [Nocardioides aquaticus]
MSDFFPDPPDAPIEPEEAPQPVWLNPPDDQLPGVVPVELIIGRSDQAVMMLTGLRAFPTGVAMTLLVRTRARMRRFDLNDEVFDGPYRHDQDDDWRRNRLKWGFEFADGRRATSVDAWPGSIDPQDTPAHPVLSGGGGGGGPSAVDRNYWLWPLPPAGALKVVCQWPQLGIGPTTSQIDANSIHAAATRAQPIWPSD